MGVIFFVVLFLSTVRCRDNTVICHQDIPRPRDRHYNDVIMSALVSQITSLTIVYSIVYSRRRSKKTSKLRVTGLCAGKMLPFDDASWMYGVFLWVQYFISTQRNRWIGVFCIVLCLSCYNAIRSYVVGIQYAYTEIDEHIHYKSYRFSYYRAIFLTHWGRVAHTRVSKLGHRWSW